MSEFDSLSDSDWLDVAGRVSDDNDSLSSRPLSRRSSLSLGSSHGSEVEAWEGFVDDEPALQPAVSLVQPAPRPADDIPDISQDDQKALDQSLVGTLSASRTSTAAHSSIRDLRLSFPDPLTGPPDHLNTDYLEHPILRSHSAHQPTPVTPQACQPQQSANIDLDIILYGSSSPIKWSFVQSLVQKAASFSGNLLISSLDPDNGPVQTLHLRCEKDNSILFTINVHDCTNDTPYMDDTDHVLRASLAIVYLPAATLPVLSLHSAYLPVLVPTSADQVNSVLRHAAEDDWELLGVPAHKTIFLTSDKEHLSNADVLSCLEPYRAFQVIHQAIDSPARQIKTVSDNGHPTRAVTLFALVSIMMGVAFNTAFYSSAGTNRVFDIDQGNQFNQTLVVPIGTSTAPSSLKDFSLSVVPPGIKSLSVKSFHVNSLSTTSHIDSLSVHNHPSLSHIFTPPSPVMTSPPCYSPSPTVTSDMPQASSSKDMQLHADLSTSHSEVKPEPSIFSATRIGKKYALPDLMKPNALSLRLGSELSEALDTGVRIFQNTGGFDNGVKDLVEAMDSLMNSIQVQTQSVVSQGKGKARAVGEEIVLRNDKARSRAKDLKKKGEKLLDSASAQFFERTEVAKQRAKDLKDALKKTEAWKSYERAHADITAKLKATESYALVGGRREEDGWMFHKDEHWHDVPLPVY